MIWGRGPIRTNVSVTPSSMEPSRFQAQPRPASSRSLRPADTHFCCYMGGLGACDGPGSLPSPHWATDTGVIPSDRWVNKAAVHGGRPTERLGKGYVLGGPIGLVCRQELPNIVRVYHFNFNCNLQVINTDYCLPRFPIASSRSNTRPSDSWITRKCIPERDALFLGGVLCVHWKAMARGLAHFSFCQF